MSEKEEVSVSQRKQEPFEGAGFAEAEGGAGILENGLFRGRGRRGWKVSLYLEN